MQYQAVNFKNQVFFRTLAAIGMTMAYTSIQFPAMRWLHSPLSLRMLAASDDLTAGFVSPDASAYRSMTEAQLTEILADRLDSPVPGETRKLAEHILSLCRKYQFDASFILSMIQAESGFHARIVSGAGAVGLLQIMPATASVVYRDNGQFNLARHVTEQTLMNPFTNVDVGIAYLAYLRDRYQGLSPYYVLAAYNLGPARLDELRAQKSFKPVKTRRYFESVWHGMFQFRRALSGPIAAR